MSDKATQQWHVLVVGVAQDAGYPQCGCARQCCRDAVSRQYATSVAAVYVPVGDDASPQVWLFDCTPDFAAQHALLTRRLGELFGPLPLRSPHFRDDQATALRGVFLTHAHVGHYLGLAQFGREAMDARQLPVYCAPRMRHFLANNGPWSQLVELGQLAPVELLPDSPPVQLRPDDGGPPLPVQVVSVPHRAEYSETYAYIIGGHTLYMPDVDHLDWDVAPVLRRCRRAFVDATFYDAAELPGRDLATIPHPLVVDSMAKLADFAPRVSYIHFNHSNPLLWSDAVRQSVRARGFAIAEQGDCYPLESTTD